MVLAYRVHGGLVSRRNTNVTISKKQAKHGFALQLDGIIVIKSIVAFGSNTLHLVFVLEALQARNRQHHENKQSFPRTSSLGMKHSDACEREQAKLCFDKLQLHSSKQKPSST